MNFFDELIGDFKSSEYILYKCNNFITTLNMKNLIKYLLIY
jgi:hypothetical protein